MPPVSWNVSKNCDLMWAADSSNANVLGILICLWEDQITSPFTNSASETTCYIRLVYLQFVQIRHGKQVGPGLMICWYTLMSSVPLDNVRLRSQQLSNTRYLQRGTESMTLPQSIALPCWSQARLRVHSGTLRPRLSPHDAPLFGRGGRLQRIWQGRVWLWKRRSLDHMFQSIQDSLWFFG